MTGRKSAYKRSWARLFTWWSIRRAAVWQHQVTFFSFPLQWVPEISSHCCQTIFCLSRCGMQHFFCLWCEFSSLSIFFCEIGIFKHHRTIGVQRKLQRNFLIRWFLNCSSWIDRNEMQMGAVEVFSLKAPKKVESVVGWAIDQCYWVDTLNLNWSPVSLINRDLWCFTDHQLRGDWYPLRPRCIYAFSSRV